MTNLFSSVLHTSTSAGRLSAIEPTSSASWPAMPIRQTSWTSRRPWIGIRRANRRATASCPLGPPDHLALAQPSKIFAGADQRRDRAQTDAVTLSGSSGGLSQTARARRAMFKAAAKSARAFRP